MQDVREWAAFGASQPVVSATKKYTGGYAVRYSTNQKPVGVQFAAQSGIRVGMWLNHNGVSAINNILYLFAVKATATLVAEVTWNTTTNVIDLLIDGVSQASSTTTALGLAATDQWIHLGFTYLPGIEKCTFWVNGLPALSYVGSLTANPTEAYGGGHKSGTGGWGLYCYMDDFYVDGDVSADEAPPPDRFLFSLASAAGASAQWTPTGQATNIACVDEAVPNDDTDYVKAEAADLVDLYATADITLPTDYGIVSVIPIALAKRMASGLTLKLVAADGVSANLESDEKTPGTSYGYVWEAMPLAPDGGDWTESKVNGAQFGVKSAGVYA